VRLIGSFSYHFWMSDMKPPRRRSGNQHRHRASPEYRDAVRIERQGSNQMQAFQLASSAGGGGGSKLGLARWVVSL
jgi:hypothetical protein